MERASFKDHWLKQTAESLKALKRDGQLSKYIWKAVTYNCPDKALLPELKKAVGVSFLI